MNAGTDVSSVASITTDTTDNSLTTAGTAQSHEAGATPRRLACPHSTLVPTKSGEEIDDHGLLQELWPRETQAQLDFQVRLSSLSCVCV